MVSKLVHMLWVVFLSGGWCWCPSDACWDTEKTALLQLKPLFDNYIESGLQNWVEGSDCCEWERVECNNSTRRVIRLSFSITTTQLTEYSNLDRYFGEDRYLSVSLFLPFEELQSLYLSGNSIADFLDHQEFKKLSRKLKKLEILDLSENHFNNDSIFASLSELSSLKYLYLGNNQFNGSVPNDGIKRLLKLKKLKTLNLDGNNFRNIIISNLRNFTSLRSLSLQQCGLRGTLEIQELNNLVNLKELNLTENAIESLGSSFQGDQLRLKKLEVLDLSLNNFNNNIFSTLSLPNLKSLHIGGNRLKGTVHIKELNALSSLEELYMWDNRVTDFVPSQGETRLKKLEVLDLSDNRFNNTIFSSLSSISNLKSLDISSNILEGPVHIKELNGLSSLEELYMGYNQVNEFVQSPGNERLMNLKVVYLSGNLFNNSILASIARLSKLKSLSLGGSNIQGSIDLTELNALIHLEDLSLHCDSVFYSHTDTENSNCSLRLQSLALFPALKRLYLRGFTSIQGSIMTSPYDKSHNFSNLEEFYLYDSFLQSNFLGSIGNFTSLKCIHIPDGWLNGTLQDITGICELGNLKDLDLSENYLKGSLPECFSNLTSLESLDLSSNELSGNISPLQTLTSLQTLHLYYNQFSGNINALKSLASLQGLSLSYNNFQIPISLGPLFNLSKLQYIDADNNIISAETQMHSLGAPAFQLKWTSLSCYGDVGSLPEFLYHQHDLEYLDLSNIYFKGNQFPNWLLENNTRLEELHLTNTSLSGPLQLPLASHMHLSYLDISNNFFDGSIPIEIGEKLPWLGFLNVSKNHLVGSIPSSFGVMSSLKSLDLSNNQLFGGIPEHLTMSCPSLQVLALSNNKLEGKVFSENFNLTSLTELRLDGNNFSGKIPDVLSKSPSLSTLDVSKNQLSGGIPRWVGNMSVLVNMVMSNNHLQGTIPVEFCQLEWLMLLDLSVNNISGTLPSCFSPSRQITQVNLSKNRLRGTLPKALRNSSTLVTLDISHNFFTGTIPSWIGELSTLSYLLLSNNFFQGDIPLELCKLSQLSLINLSHNNLSGRIPPCLKITTLEDAPVPEDNFVDGSTSTSSPSPETQFSLNEPIDFPIKNVSNSYRGKIIALVSGIDLSCNKLVGEIPYEFGNFYKIIVLNLSHNSLTGPIPPTFANLKKIESLDLSYNKLSGSIPAQLVELNFLAYFIVSFNNLSGKTPPRSAQFGTFDESSYRGNPFLCGEPLPKCADTGPSSPVPNSSTGYDEDDGLIDMEVFRVSFAMCYMVLLLTIAAVLYINPYWRRAWFYHAETTATACYYFVLDNIPPRRCHC